MDIGTAKPDTDYQKRFDYHLIDICSPEEQYSAGVFFEKANAACSKIYEQGRIPVLEGGTVYYINTFLTGMPQAPVADANIRQQLEKELRERGFSWLCEELHRLDPNSKVPLADSYRVQRAVEICRQTGRPASEFRVPVEIRTELQVLVIALQRDRSQLYDRINERVDMMFATGLEQEINRLVAAGWGKNAPGMRAIGYQEFFADDGSRRSDIQQVRGLIQRNSRRFAKRQESFIKRLPSVLRIHPDNSALLGQFVNEFCQGLDH